MTKQKKFGTFQGVFTPTILTIVGVILYLRLGWVIGSVGFYKTFVIIVLAHLVTLPTGLSTAALATNTNHIGAGGFYPLIMRSLGLEIGSAIGIPLFFSQAIGVSLYITGFTEIWLSLYPLHDPFTVKTILFSVLFLMAIAGADFALKIQYLVMGVIIVSIGSFIAAKTYTNPLVVHKNIENPAEFWKVFAVFFPAVTGIGAGAAMSGDLKNPQKSLPAGILSAIGAGFIIYCGIAFLIAKSASADELTSDMFIMVTKSFFPPLVVAGIMGATFSSALGSILGAPRILMAIAENKMIPFSSVLKKTNRKGNPVYAIILSGIIIETSLYFGDLNTIATLLTMFFLISYAFINLAVFLEQFLSVPSFRPSFSVPKIIPLIGGLWSSIVMFILNPLFAGIGFLLIVAIYIIQIQRNLTNRYGDLRAGIISYFAEWFGRQTTRYPAASKTWKPNFIIPVEDPLVWQPCLEFITDLVYPHGTIRFFSVNVTESAETKADKIINFFKEDGSLKRLTPDNETLKRDRELENLVKPLTEKRIFTTAKTIEAKGTVAAISIATQISKGMFFPPNLIFLTMGENPSKDKGIKELLAVSIRSGLGICLFYLHPKAALGTKDKINIWIRHGSKNQHLAFLSAFLLNKRWEGSIRLVSLVNHKADVEKRTETLRAVSQKTRLPADTETYVEACEFETLIENPPPASLNIMGIPDNLNLEPLHRVCSKLKTSILFVYDSGDENILA